MFPIVNMSTLTARSYKINKTPIQAFTPHASNENMVPVRDNSSTNKGPKNGYR